MKAENILLIDDDEDYLFLTQKDLEKLQISKRISVATNGEDALNFIKNNCIKDVSEDYPIILFIDNHMPGMNGVNFLEKLQELEGVDLRKFQIYIVSSLTDDRDQDVLNNYAIKGFIDKPLSLQKIMDIFGI